MRSKLEPPVQQATWHAECGLFERASCSPMRPLLETSVSAILALLLPATVVVAQAPPVQASGAVSKGQSSASVSEVKAIDDAFKELCSPGERNKDFHVCALANRGVSLPGRLKVFVLQQACEADREPPYCSWATTILADLDLKDDPNDPSAKIRREKAKKALKQATGALLLYNHRDDAWRAISPAESAENIDKDANGIPTVYRSRDLDLAVVVEDTNPLAYEVHAGAVTETELPLVADLKALAGLLGTGIAGAVTTVTSRLSSTAGVGGPGAEKDPDLLEPKAMAGDKASPLPLPTPPPTCPMCDLGPATAVKTVMAAVDEKRRRWSRLRELADDLARGVAVLDARRLAAVRLVQALESKRPDTPPLKATPVPVAQATNGESSAGGSPAPAVSIGFWTPENVLDESRWDGAFERLRTAVEEAATFSSRYERLFETYLAIVGAVPEEAPKEPGTSLKESARAASKYFLSISTDGEVCQMREPCGPRALEKLRKTLRNSAECIVCLSRQLDVGVLFERLKRDQEVLKSGLEALRVSDDERDAIPGLRSVLQQKKDHLKVVEAIRNAREREAAFTLNRHLVTWAHLRPRSDKFSWDKEGSHEVKVTAASPFDADILKRRRDVTTTYKVRSRLSTVFGVSTGVAFTDLRQPTWSPVCSETKDDGSCKTFVAHQTGEESRSGHLIFSFDVRPLEFVSDKARKAGFKPLAIAGVGVTGELPAFFIGLGFELARELRYIRLGFGRTAQKFNELHGVMPDVTPLTGEVVPTRDVFRWGWFGSISLNLDAISLFTRPAS